MVRAQVLLRGPGDEALQFLHVQGTLGVCPTCVTPETDNTHDSYGTTETWHHLGTDYKAIAHLTTDLMVISELIKTHSQKLTCITVCS